MLKSKTEIEGSPCQNCDKNRTCYKGCQERFDFWDERIGAIRAALYKREKRKEEDHVSD